MDKIVSEMTSRAFVAPSSATKDDSPLSSADVRTIVIIIKINCQRDQYHQVKAKLEGQATAMMGVTLLNLGIFTLDSSSSSPSSSSSSSSSRSGMRTGVWEGMRGGAPVTAAGLAKVSSSSSSSPSLSLSLSP